MERFVIGFFGYFVAQVMTTDLGKLEFSANPGVFDFDDTFVEWYRIVSASSEVVLEFVGNHETTVHMMIVLVAEEMFRYLILFHMGFSTDRVVYEHGFPSRIQVLGKDVRSSI